MPANTAPIFTLTPNVGHAKVTAANTSSQGGGTIASDIFKAFTAGANGSFVTRVQFVPTATAAGTTTTATVGRVFLSTVGSSATTGASDTWLVAEVTLPQVTADSASAPANIIEVMLNFAIPAGTFIHVTNHAAPASSTAWIARVIGGDY